MHEKPTITCIRESHYTSPHREGSAFVMPLLISSTLVGMALLYFQFWDQGDIVPQDQPPVITAKSPDGENSEKQSQPPVPVTLGESVPSYPIIHPITEADFTPWMSQLALRTYILQKNRGYAVSYWERGHWIRAVEGRWRNGDTEYRIALGQMDRPHQFEWQHQTDLTEADFAKEDSAMQIQGYRLIQTQSYALRDGTLRTQAVWRRDTTFRHENLSTTPDSKPNVVSQVR